jgi:MATE family multidrug resistance protein
LSKQERERVLEEERSLLRDNNVIPPKHPQEGEMRRKGSIFGSLLKVPGGDRKVISPEQAPSGPEDGAVAGITEATALLGDPQLPYGGQDSPEIIAQKWEEAVKEGKIQTTWQREAKVLGSYAGPLMITFVLQYSLTVASIFTVGHLGKAELGAVSLASMSANITGYAVYQGLATSLDTLCAQAYGSGRKKLVGLQMQRMVYFLWVLTIPIGIVWILAEKILMVIVPEPAVAKLAGLYLKVVLAGAPGYACFESGKRFVQAQGLFSASLYVLLFCAPFNAFLNWFFVWVSDSHALLGTY